MSVTPSTTIITHLKNAATPTSNTMRTACASAIDVNGMLALAQTKALELKTCLTLVTRATDAADPNLATFDNVLASLS